MEMPHIGKNCALKDCNTLDFLPHACPFCRQDYCLDHRFPAVHACKSWRDSNDLQTCPACGCSITTPSGTTPSDALSQHINSSCRSNLYTPPTHSQIQIKASCQEPECKRIEAIYSTCGRCGGVFCLQHRHIQDHSFLALPKTAEESKRQQAKDHAMSVLAKNFPSSKKSISTIKSKPKVVNKKLALVKLRNKATGRISITMAQRLYFTVQHEFGEINVFVDKDWSTGRCLDYVAEVGKVRNVNNTSTDDKDRLHMYFGDSRLDPSKAIKDVIEDADTIRLVRGAG